MRTDYYDFHVALEIEKKGPEEGEEEKGGQPRVVARILRSLAGRGSAPFEIPRPVGSRGKAFSSRQAAEARGRALFEALFNGVIGDKYRRSAERLTAFEEAVPNRSCCLRIRLAIDPAKKELTKVFGQDWEEMFDEEQDCFLTRNHQATLIRDLELPTVLRELPGDSTLRILVVGAQPEGWRSVGVEDELARIEKAWQEHGDVVVEPLFGASPSDLKARLRKDPIHILHFIGHGEVDHDENEGMLVFEDEAKAPVKLSGKQLAEHLRVDNHVRLVILCACETSEGPPGLPARSVAASLMKAGIPAVVAMRREVADSSAQAFSTGLHGALAEGMEIDAAMTHARLGIDATDENFYQWATPTLFMSSLDGRIFRFGGADKEEEMEPKTLGIRTRYIPYGEINEESEHVLDLTPFFKGRPIRDPAAWSDEVLPYLRHFLRQHVETLRPLRLRFDAHLTIAFAAGWQIATRPVAITLRQALPSNGFRDWRYEFDEPWEGPLWKVQERPRFGADEHEVALAIGVTHDNLAPVERYINRHLNTRVCRLIGVTPDPRTGHDAIRNANHAFALAQELLRLIDRRTEEEQRGPLHLFFAAPWSLAFYVGQLARGMGEIQLYEWEFEKRGTRTYDASLRLRPNNEEDDDDADLQ